MKISKEFKIGVIVVLGVAALVWGVSFLKGSDILSRKYYLYAIYPRIDNLIPANPMLINGFKVGQVNSISLVEEGPYKNQVIVKFVLTEEVNIPVKSIAKAVSSDLLGTKAVEVEFSKEKEFVKNGDTLLSGSEENLREAVNKQIAPLQAKALSLIGSIDSAMTVVTMLLNPKTRDNIDRSFESVRKAILSLEQTAYKLDDLVASEKGKVSNVMTNLNNISTNLNNNEQKLNNIITNFSNLSDTLAKSQLRSAVANASATMKELNELMTRINRGEGTLGKLAKNDSLYNNLNSSAASLDRLLKDLESNPKRYVHFSIFGKKDKKKTQN
ncbi:MAG: MlaD family protein [Bacteroidia bacterium]|nr:MlaD family protein [Bacteroidia bacterium]